MRRKRSRQASPMYCRRCGKRLGPSGTELPCPSCGAGQATVRDGYVIVRPSQLVESSEAEPASPVAPWERVGRSRIIQGWRRSVARFVRSRIAFLAHEGRLLDALLAERRVSPSVVIGLLITTLAVGVIVPLLAR